MSKISFVIPCYRSEKTISGVIDEINSTMVSLPQYTYEIVLVNDCSPDGTFDVICDMVQKDSRITGINLAKNFGQHSALMAGYANVTGDIIVSLDDDGQVPVNEVSKLLEQIEHGQDIVYARYAHKQHSGFRNLGSKINEMMARVMLDKPKDLYLSSFYAARRFVIDEILNYNSPYPYVMGLCLRTTKRITNVDVTHRERTIGTSGYTFSKLFGLWMNGFTAFSVKPLRIATLNGVILAIMSIIYGIYTIIKKFVNPNVPVGYSALICALVFIGGMIMLMLGLAGEYIGRTYMAINKSPQYVIRDKVSSDDSN